MRPIVIILIILAVVIGGWFLYQQKASAPVVHNDLIKVYEPAPNDTISSPLVVKGEARGQWYFEASFPIKILDGTGAIIESGVAQAKDEWMTTEYVPFEAVLTFNQPITQTGTLVLQKDNPSGLPENADEFRIPVKFITSSLAADSGTLRGYVHVGPTCPVERIPPDPNCAEKPYSVSIEIHYPDEQLYKIIKSGADGRFSVVLPAGDYILRPQVANVLPACSEARVTIMAKQTTNVDISCDSGIR